jgi:Leucine-rich repeat (LRR) protein
MKKRRILQQNNIQRNPSRRKRIIPTAIILFIITGLIYRAITWTTIDSQSRKASEAIICQAAAEQLNKDPNKLTDEDFIKIKDLRIENYELADIKFLEKFTNLQRLFIKPLKLPESTIPTWMKVLTKLGVYDLNKKFALDLSPLEKLSNLQTLGIAEIQIKNIKSLLKLTKLEHIYFDYIELLKELTNLKLLSLAGNKISDLELISTLENLQVLNLSGTKVSTLEPIWYFINLQKLNLNGCNISNLEPIKKLKNLEILNLERCEYITNEQVEDLQKTLPNLKIER